MAEPRWLTLARSDLGLRETPGIANNPIIVRRLAAIPKLIGMMYNADSVPWCGAMLAWWMNQCGIKPPPVAARALSWADWGVRLRPERIAAGAVMVKTRKGGGHVTLYVGEDDTHYYGLGANQGDSVSIARFLKGEITAIRWPEGEPVLNMGAVYVTSVAAAKIPSGVKEA